MYRLTIPTSVGISGRLGNGSSTLVTLTCHLDRLSLCHGHLENRVLATFTTDFDEDRVHRQPISEVKEGLLLVQSYVCIENGLMAGFT
jgi:predicted ABC-type transport system involved in lysophospholipase L1 biosynthesis ATPase subunit